MLTPVQKKLVRALIANNKTEFLETLKAANNVNFFVALKNPYQKLTLLMLAAQFSDSEVVTALLEKGAETNTTDNMNRNVLHYAQYGKKLESAKLLVFKNPFLRLQNGHLGFTPLHEAAYYNLTDFLKFYLNTPEIPIGNVDTKSKFKDTLLYVAVRAKNIEAMELLLKSGAHPEREVEPGESPLNEAIVRHKSNPELARIIRSHMIPTLFALAAESLSGVLHNSKQTIIPSDVCEKAQAVVKYYQSFQVNNRAIKISIPCAEGLSLEKLTISTEP